MADVSAAAQAALSAAMLLSVNPDLLATAHFGKAISIPRHSGRAPYVIHLSSLAEQNEFGRGADAPRAILFINDPAEPLVVNAHMLSSIYGLTPAEVRAAEAIVNGGAAEEVASALGVTEHTVRAQLKQIYAKTGVNSRARLVKLVYAPSSP